MKKIIALLMALLLAALPAGAEENRLIDLGTDEYDNSLYVFGMAAVGDALYVACDQALYVLREGEESFTPCTPEIRLENLYVDGGEEDIDINGVALFGGDGGLKGLCALRGADYAPRALGLFDVKATDDGRLEAENAVQLPLPDELEGMDWIDVRHAVLHEGLLYLVCEGESGMVLCVIDPENPGSARSERLDSWEHSLVATDGGPLLASRVYDDGEANTRISRVGMDASLQELCRLPIDDVNTLAADPEGDGIYAVSRGRVCPVDLEAGALGAPVAALAVDAECAVLAFGGRCYAASMQNFGVALLDTEGRLDEDAVLMVAADFSGDSMRRATLRFAVEHPEVAPVLTYESGDALEAMMTQSADTDVYIRDLRYNGSYESLLNRGYMLPLDGSEALTALYERVYPGVQPFIGNGGAPVALPVYVSGSCMGVDTVLLEKLGLTLDDVPDSWPEFLDFMQEALLPRLELLGENERFTYDDMTANGFRFFLFQQILNDWVQANRAAGKVADYEDPRLVDTLEKLDAMDFTAFGMEEGNDEDGYGYGWGGDVRYLVQFDREFTFQSMEMEGEIIAMGFGDDLPGVYALDMCCAFVNPYSAHREAAVAYLEALADALPAEVLYALCPDMNEPVRRDNWEQSLARMEEQVAELQKNLEEAEPAEKQEIEVELSYITRDYEDYREKGSWLIPADRLARYRAIGDKLTVSLPTWFQKDTSGEAWELMEQYRSRLISAREFLAAVNKKARMMELEAG